MILTDEDDDLPKMYSEIDEIVSATNVVAVSLWNINLL